MADNDFFSLDNILAKLQADEAKVRPILAKAFFECRVPGLQEFWQHPTEDALLDPATAGGVVELLRQLASSNVPLASELEEGIADAGDGEMQQGVELLAAPLVNFFSATAAAIKTIHHVPAPPTPSILPLREPPVLHTPVTPIILRTEHNNGQPQNSVGALTGGFERLDSMGAESTISSLARSDSEQSAATSYATAYSRQVSMVSLLPGGLEHPPELAGGAEDSTQVHEVAGRAHEGSERGHTPAHESAGAFAGPRDGVVTGEGIVAGGSPSTHGSHSSTTLGVQSGQEATETVGTLSGAVHPGQLEAGSKSANQMQAAPTAPPGTAGSAEEQQEAMDPAPHAAFAVAADASSPAKVAAMVRSFEERSSPRQEEPFPSPVQKKYRSPRGQSSVPLVDRLLASQSGTPLSGTADYAQGVSDAAQAAEVATSSPGPREPLFGASGHHGGLKRGEAEVDAAVSNVRTTSATSLQQRPLILGPGVLPGGSSSLGGEFLHGAASVNLAREATTKDQAARVRPAGEDPGATGDEAPTTTVPEQSPLKPAGIVAGLGTHLSPLLPPSTASEPSVTTCGDQSEPRGVGTSDTSKHSPPEIQVPQRAGSLEGGGGLYLASPLHRSSPALGLDAAASEWVEPWGSSAAPPLADDPGRAGVLPTLGEVRPLAAGAAAEEAVTVAAQADGDTAHDATSKPTPTIQVPRVGASERSSYAPSPLPPGPKDRPQGLYAGPTTVPPGQIGGGNLAAARDSTEAGLPSVEEKGLGLTAEENGPTASLAVPFFNQVVTPSPQDAGLTIVLPPRSDPEKSLYESSLLTPASRELDGTPTLEIPRLSGIEGRALYAPSPLSTKASPSDFASLARLQEEQTQRPPGLMGATGDAVPITGEVFPGDNEAAAARAPRHEIGQSEPAATAVVASSGSAAGHSEKAALGPTAPTREAALPLGVTAASSLFGSGVLDASTEEWDLDMFGAGSPLASKHVGLLEGLAEEGWQGASGGASTVAASTPVRGVPEASGQGPPPGGEEGGWSHALVASEGHWETFGAAPLPSHASARAPPPLGGAPPGGGNPFDSPAGSGVQPPSGQRKDSPNSSVPLQPSYSGLHRTSGDWKASGKSPLPMSPSYSAPQAVPPVPTYSHPPWASSRDGPRAAIATASTSPLPSSYGSGTGPGEAAAAGHMGAQDGAPSTMPGASPAARQLFAAGGGSTAADQEAPQLATAVGALGISSEGGGSEQDKSSTVVPLAGPDMAPPVQPPDLGGGLVSSDAANGSEPASRAGPSPGQPFVGRDPSPSQQAAASAVHEPAKDVVSPSQGTPQNGTLEGDGRGPTQQGELAAGAAGAEVSALPTEPSVAAPPSLAIPDVPLIERRRPPSLVILSPSVPAPAKGPEHADSTAAAAAAKDETKRGQWSRAMWGSRSQKEGAGDSASKGVPENSGAAVPRKSRSMSLPSRRGSAPSAAPAASLDVPAAEGGGANAARSTRLEGSDGAQGAELTGKAHPRSKRKGGLFSCVVPTPPLD